MIGIVGALQEEVDVLTDRLAQPTTDVRAGLKFTTGLLENKPVVLCKSGVGKVLAAMTTQLLISTYRPVKVLFSGVAGGLVDDLNQGDLVIATRVVQHDLDVLGHIPGEFTDPRTEFWYRSTKERVTDTPLFDRGTAKLKQTRVAREIETDAALRQALADSFDDISELLEGSPRIKLGPIATGDAFIADPEHRKWIVEQFGAICVEMEGAALGFVCHFNDTPFGVVRAISDSSNAAAPLDFSTFKAVAARNAALLVTNWLRRS